MVNVFAVVSAVVVFFVLLLVDVYLVVHFQSPQDKNSAYFPKFLVVSGMLWSEIGVLMLTLDVANGNGDIPMSTLWFVLYLVMAVYAVVLMPFSQFYYEGEDPDTNDEGRFRSAVIQTVITFFVVVACLMIAWVFFGVAELDFQDLRSDAIPQALLATIDCANCSGTGGTIDFRVSILLFIISLFSFVGTFLFVLFGGIGLGGFPVDLWREFKHRPKVLSLDRWARAKLDLGQRAEDLLASGRELEREHERRRRLRRKDKANFRRFRQAVYLLEEEYVTLKSQRNAGNRLLHVWGYLALGLAVLALVASIMWILHTIIYVAWPGGYAHPFLNNMLTGLNDAFPFLAVIMYALLSFYLLMCVIKGIFLFGLRIPFFFRLHPIKLHGTFMNSFLFNVFMILVTSVAVTHYVTTSFSIYAVDTAANDIFNTATNHLKGIRYVWEYIYWGLVALPIVSGIVLFCKGPPKRFDQRFRELMREEKDDLY